MKKIFVKSKNLEIRKFEKKHISEKYISWLNNKRLMKYSDQRFYKHDFKSVMNYFDFMKKKNNFFFAIIEKSSHLGHIGNISVYFDKQNKTAEMSILIGEKKARGLSYGLEAWSSVLFELLKMKSVNKVVAGTMKINKKMVSIMKKSKMKKAGERKSFIYHNKSYQDLVFYQK